MFNMKKLNFLGIEKKDGYIYYMQISNKTRNEMNPIFQTKFKGCPKNADNP